MEQNYRHMSHSLSHGNLNDKFIKETEKVNSYETQFIPTDVWWRNMNK